MRTLDHVIVESSVFAGMDAGQIELLAGCARNVRFADGERVFREGDPADVFYLVRHGRIALETFVPNRGALVIETVDDGDPVGWSWLFPPYRWHFDGRAVGLVRAVAFEAPCLRDKCSADPVLGYELLTRFSAVLLERLQATRLRLVDIYGDGTR
jgi:CRP-like cAMP-binding protein